MLLPLFNGVWILARRWKPESGRKGSAGPLPLRFLPSMDPCHQEAPLPLEPELCGQGPERSTCTQCDMKLNSHGRTRTRMWLLLWARGAHLQLAHVLFSTLSAARAPPGGSKPWLVSGTRLPSTIHQRKTPARRFILMDALSPPAACLVSPSLPLPHGFFTLLSRTAGIDYRFSFFPSFSRPSLPLGRTTAV